MTSQKPILPPFIDNAERTARLQLLRQAMADQGQDAVILIPGANMRYVCGLNWSESERFVGAVVTDQQMILVCPKFEDTAVAARLPATSDMVFWEEHEDPYALIASILADHGCKSCSLDPNCNYGHAAHIFGASMPVQYSSAHMVLAPLRNRKSPAELALMMAAKQLTLNVHRMIFGWIKPGMRASEVRLEIDRLHRIGGADNGSSFCAVQFAEATSHPHGVPHDQTLQPGELILIDTGCTIDGYNSDITRTYALDHVDSEIERLWIVEKEAQQAAFDLAAPGIACEDVDQAARDVLTLNGLGPDYTLPGLPHRTGHGIGLDIHETPYLVRGDKTSLAQGMCFSNEPMIVVPSKFGIRLEDHFYITDRGAAWFTEPQHSLYRPFE